MNVTNKLKKVAAFLKNKGIEGSAKEAETLLTEALHINKSRFYSADIKISSETSRYIDSLAERRAKGEPIQYILGYIEFCGLKINVSREVFIPRPETELLAEKAIKLLTVYPASITILDLCTGSGCIALALAKHFRDATVYGVDKSQTATDCAVKNAHENDIKNVHFITGDLFEPIDWDARFNCIISNPPYIKRDDIQGLQREIRDHEPTLALDGRDDGLYFYRRIIKHAAAYLKKDGFVAFEIGYNQADDIEKIAISTNFVNISFIKDYAGIKRIFVGFAQKVPPE